MASVFVQINSSLMVAQPRYDSAESVYLHQSLTMVASLPSDAPDTLTAGAAGQAPYIPAVGGGTAPRGPSGESWQQKAEAEQDRRDADTDEQVKNMFKGKAAKGDVNMIGVSPGSFSEISSAQFIADSRDLRAQAQDVHPPGLGSGQAGGGPNIPDLHLAAALRDGH